MIPSALQMILEENRIISNTGIKFLAEPLFLKDCLLRGTDIYSTAIISFIIVLVTRLLIVELMLIMVTLEIE